MLKGVKKGWAKTQNNLLEKVGAKNYNRWPINLQCFTSI